MQPLKSDTEVQSHITVLNKFREGSAQKLHALLKQTDSACAMKKGVYPFSYVEDIWDKNFLSFRGCSPINISPAVTLRPISQRSASQCRIAAEYVHACMRWYTKLQSGALDIVGFESKHPLDISELATQFGCCRLSREGIDTKKITVAPRHIILLHRAHAFEVQIISGSGKYMTVDALEKAMEHIVAATHEDNALPISIFSTGGRNDLVEYMQEIDASGTQRELLQRVNSSFLTVCLDTYPASDGDARLQAAMHGIGRDRNNRWFDRNQLIVSKDGYVSMNFEQAFSDRVSWGRWIAEVWHALHGTTRKTPFSPLPSLPASRATVAPFRELVFSIPSSMSGVLNTAKQSWRAAAKNLYQGSLMADFGYHRLRKYGVDPDAFMHMAFHLAFYRLSGRMAPTYHSVPTSTFFHGRTENVRSATKEMLAFVRCEGLDDPTAVGLHKRKEARHLARQACKVHAELVSDALVGLGIDRHLLTLNTLAAADKSGAFEDANAFFDSPMYSYSGNWQIYTANAMFPFFEGFSVGPVMEHGYGLGYIMHDDFVSCTVSSFLSSRKAKGSEMRDGILQSMRDISALFEHDTHTP